VSGKCAQDWIMNIHLASGVPPVTPYDKKKLWTGSDSGDAGPT
jgi:hypothetical protein